MDCRRARRRRNWIILWVVVVGVPAVAYLGYALVVVIVMANFD